MSTSERKSKFESIKVIKDERTVAFSKVFKYDKLLSQDMISNSSKNTAPYASDNILQSKDTIRSLSSHSISSCSLLKPYLTWTLDIVN